jgi:hypothetical protein
MKRGGAGFEQCYNAQIAADETERMIVATGVTQSASDVDQLIPLLDEVKTNAGKEASCCLADAGYRSESNLQALESRRIDGYVAMGREKDGTSKAPDSKLESTARMARKLPGEARRAGLPQAQVDRGATVCVDQVRDGLRPLPSPRVDEGDQRMGPGLPGGQSASHTRKGGLCVALRRERRTPNAGD